ncbi:HORMA domain-containing protein [Pestalotiopsis sp. NC0098]|nr:HORMA domain-containing protein [Pestalotiopsis sp. NC0098]
MPSEVQNDLVTLSLTQSSHLLLSFTHFLTVAIHNVLFYRSLYPPTTFLTTRAYNLAVHQSRHPAVCNWIRDAVDAVRAQLVLGSVSRVAIVIHAPDARVLERWMIDVAQFPAFKGYREPRGNRRDEEDDAAQQQRDARVNWTDVDEAFRGTVRRMALAGEKMAALPEGCSFTVAVELRDESEAPIGYPQSWIPSEPNLQTSSKDKPMSGEDVGGAKTRPIRSVEVGPLFFECWVEEGKAKDNITSSNTSSE